MRDPSPDDPSSAPQRAGFVLPFAIVANPRRAFELIATTREWLPAYLIIAGLSIAELFLDSGALAHIVASHAGGTDSALSAHQQLDQIFINNVAAAVLLPFVANGFVATLLAAATIGRERPAGSFARYFSLAMNCAVPAELGGLLYAVAINGRDPSTFRTGLDLSTVLPLSLAALRPHGPPPEIAFLSYWSVFALWSLVLLGCGYATLSKMRLVPALLVAMSINFVFSLMSVDVAT